MLDSIEDEELSDGGADAEDQQVDDHLRMVVHETQRLVQLFLMHQRDERKHRREGIHNQHHLQWRQRCIQCEHASLPLASERVEEEEQHQQHHAAHRTGDVLRIAEDVVVQVNLLSRV